MHTVFPNRNDLCVWLRSSEEGAVDDYSDSYTLLTASNIRGSETVLLYRGRILSVKPNSFVQAPRERVRSGTEKYGTVFYRLYVTVGYCFLAVLMTFSVLSFGGVVKARVVLTESMQPLINPGDVVVTTPVSRKEPVVGDVVTYIAKRFDGSPVGTFTHRIIDGDKKTGFVVKGDNNPAPDVQRPKYEDIAGVLLFTIPFIGTLMTPRSLAILIPTLFGIWLVIDALRKSD